MQADLQVKNWMHRSNISSGITLILRLRTAPRLISFHLLLLILKCNRDGRVIHDTRRYLKLYKYYITLVALLSLPEEGLELILNSSCLRPGVHQLLGAHMAATSSDMLISNDFPFWLQRKTATVQQR